VNKLHGYDIEDLEIGMHASFVKTITEADIVLLAAVIDGDALVMTTSREVRLPADRAKERLLASRPETSLPKRRLRSKWAPMPRILV
jgi:hypothetical protein